MENKQVTGKRAFPASCDIFQEKDRVVLRMEMPGVSRDKLDIQVDGDLLVIRGEKTYTPPKGNFLIREIREGDYQHQFTLDDTIDRNKIDAALEQGVLYLTLNMKESVKPRKIEVVAK